MFIQFNTYVADDKLGYSARDIGMNILHYGLNQ